PSTMPMPWVSTVSSRRGPAPGTCLTWRIAPISSNRRGTSSGGRWTWRTRRSESRAPRRAHCLDALFDRRLHRAIVVLRDEAMDATLEERAQDRVERLVRLAEVDARATVAEIFQARPSRRPRPQRLADGVVAPRLVRLHLGEPLPRSSDAAGQEIARHAKVTVADAALAGVVTPVEVFDAHVAVLDDAGTTLPEERPD